MYQELKIYQKNGEPKKITKKRTHTKRICYKEKI